MLDFLRDPVWNGIAGVIAIIALAAAFIQEKKFITNSKAMVLIAVKSLIGILIISLGPLIQLTVEALFSGGISDVEDLWRAISSNYGFGKLFIYAIGFAFFPGIITAIAASSGKNLKQGILRAIAAAFITTSVTDMIIGGDIFELVFAFIMNMFGAIIAGSLIGYFIITLNKLSESGTISQDGN